VKYYTQESHLADEWRTEHRGGETHLRAYAEQTGAKGAPPDVRKFVELSYLNQALTEIGKR